MKKTLMWLTPVFLFPVLLGCGAGGTPTSGMTSVTVALGSMRSTAAPATAGKASARAPRSGKVLPRISLPGLDNVRLTVSGEGMTPIVTVIEGYSLGDPDPAVELLVPSGSNRRFVAEAWGGDEIMFRGENTVTLTGTPTTVDVYVYPPWRSTLNDTESGDTPSARSLHTAVWTGSQMIVWGGLDGSSGNSLNTGARYDPVADTWAPTSTDAWTSAERSGMQSHTAVWTGTEMIVWGGVEPDLWSSPTNVGARYDPALDSWQFTSQDGAPSARRGHTAVWTGTEMIVWGGDEGDSYGLNDGARYNPVSDSWVELYAASGDPPDVRTRHTAVWTGTEMIVWGGYSDEMGDYYADGGRYDPSTETWSYISESLADAPSKRSDHTAVWTGTEMIVWGGEYDPEGVTSLADGARYTPASDSWLGMNSVDAPSERSRHTAVWTGTQMIVWGGEEWYFGSNYGTYNDGGRYDPLADTWTPTSLYEPPTARFGHTAVWAVTQMIVWGGTDDGYAGGYVSTGGRYTPW